MTEVDVIPPRRNVTLSIDVDLWDRVRAEADRRCVSPRLLVRAALRELLDRLEPLDPFPTSSTMIAEHEQPLVDQLVRRQAIIGAGSEEIAAKIEQLAHPPLTVHVPTVEPAPLDSPRPRPQYPPTQHVFTTQTTALFDQQRRVVRAQCSCGWERSETIPAGTPSPLIPADLRTRLAAAHQEHLDNLNE